MPTKKSAPALPSGPEEGSSQVNGEVESPPAAVKPRKRKADTSDSSEIKDSETENEVKARARVRKSRSARKEKKDEYSTDDSDAETQAVYQWMYGPSESDGEPAGEASKRTEAQSNPVSPMLEDEENIDGQSYQAAN